MVTAMIDHDFSAHRAVFCDSMQAIEWARCRGLPNDAVIYSSSPAVIIANSNAIDIERRLASGLGRRFLIGMNDFVHDVFTNLVRDEPFAGAAHSAAHGVFGQQCLMHKALTLRHEDLISKRLIIETTTDDAVAESILKSFWPELLAKNVNCTTVTCSVRLPTLGRSLGGRLPNLMTRIQSLRPRRALYRGLVSRVGRKFVPSLRPYCVLIARDSNELLRDTAVALALSGHKLLALDALRPEPSCLDEPSRERISTAIRSAFEQTLAGLFTPLLIDTLMAAVAVAGIQEAGRAATAKNSWCRTFREYGSNRKGPGRALMLHGGPMGGAGAGLYAAARECDIPLIAFQHGIRREIADWPIDARILNESNFADLLICYNRHAADNSGALNPYAAGQAVATGLPSDYKFRRLRLSRRKALQPLIYVSTLLYRGTKQISNTLLTDHQRAQLEITLIKEVLSQLPYRVLYKPYPAFRYADDDPVLAVASESANIDVMTSEVDLRYMVDRHRIVMTTGATSTVGWCALSGLPLVFIDDAQLLPLSPNANSAFEKAFFLFNGSSSTLHASLRNFLSRPIPEIEAEARLREAARAAVVENLFGLGHCSSAGIALKQIHRILARSQSSGLGITHGSKAP